MIACYLVRLDKQLLDGVEKFSGKTAHHQNNWPARLWCCIFQKINILIVNQCIIDMCGSFIALLSAVLGVGSTGMSRDYSWDQFVCRIWHTRALLWSFLVTSTYGILLTALERYLAVVYPIWYKVRSELLHLGTDHAYYAVLLLLLLLSLSLLHSFFIVLLKFIQLFGYPVAGMQ